MKFDTWMNYGLVIGIPMYLLSVFIFVIYKRIIDRDYMPTFDSNICDNGDGHLILMSFGFLGFGILGGIFWPFAIIIGIIYCLASLAIFIVDKIRKFLESGVKNDTER